MRTMLVLLFISVYPWGFLTVQPLDVLTMELEMSRQDLTLGETLTMHLILHPDATNIELLAISNPASEDWAWITQPAFTGIVSVNQTVSWKVSPKNSGTLKALVRVRYQSEGKIIEKQVSSNDLQVFPLASQVQANLILVKRGGWFAGPTKLQLEIINQSPFALDQIKVMLPGKNNPLPVEVPSTVIESGQAASINLESRYEEFLPVQSAVIIYQANTGVGLSVQSMRLTMEENTIKPPDWFTVNPFLSVVMGALTSLGGILLGFWLEQQRKKRGHVEQVRSLLDMFCRRAISAAQHGSELDTKPLEVIYQTEGLFRVLTNMKLVNETGLLWNLADQHNAYLLKRQGLMHSQELEKSAQSLKVKIVI